jgi:hypothetical protein
MRAQHSAAPASILSLASGSPGSDRQLAMAQSALVGSPDSRARSREIHPCARTACAAWAASSSSGCWAVPETGPSARPTVWRARDRYSAAQHSGSGSGLPRKSRRHAVPTWRSSPQLRLRTTNVLTRRRRSAQCSHRGSAKHAGSRLSPAGVNALSVARWSRCSTVAAASHPARTGDSPISVTNARPLARVAQRDRGGAEPAGAARESPDLALELRKPRDRDAEHRAAERLLGGPDPDLQPQRPADPRLPLRQPRLPGDDGAHAGRATGRRPTVRNRASARRGLPSADLGRKPYRRSQHALP